MLLINWLYYEKTILNFEDIVFLSGKTGEGKSALIDAMQLVILGRCDNSIFNKSANDKTTRDLMGYLKGKYKNGTFKRDQGSFSTHLCMEFEDEHKQAYCFGIVFDVDGATRSDMEYRFYMMNHAIPDHCFIEDGRVFDIRRMKKYLDSMQDRSKCRMFNTNMDYRNFFQARMMIKDQRFFDVFKMAVAYTPMMNISEFIVKNICQEEESLDLEEMQEEINDYRQMKEKLEEVQNKKAQLSEIHEQYVEICNEQERLDTLKIEQEAADYQCLILEKQEAIKQYETYTKEYQKLMKDAQATEEERVALNKEKDSLKDAKRDNAAGMLQRNIESCEEKQNELKIDVAAATKQALRKVHQIEEQLSTLEEVEDDEILALEDYDLSKKKLEVKKFMHATDHLSDFDMGQYQELKDDLLALEEHMNSQLAALRQEMMNQKNQLQELRENRKELEEGRKNYPKNLLVLKRELERRLEALHHKKVDVSILADIMQIKDEAYRNAIEGYIHNQKLNLIVEEEYFMDAYRIYKDIKEGYGIHTFSIVDIAKAKPRSLQGVKTLYDCVYVEREDVKAYVEYLLGRVVCCEDDERIRDYPVSVTKDCMLYSGYAVSHMNPQLYKTPFIGMDSIEKQLQEIMIQLHKLEKNYQMKQEIIEAAKQIQFRQIFNEDFTLQLSRSIEKAQMMDKLTKTIEEYRRSMTPESLEELALLDKKIEQVEKQLNRNYTIRVEQDKRKDLLERDINTCNDIIGKVKETLEEKTEPEQGIPESILLITSVDNMRKKQEQIRYDIRETSSQIDNHKDKLMYQKLHYNDTFRIALNPNFLCDDYEREYEKHSQNIVEEYVDKCALAESKAYECFQNNFFSALNSKIENVKTQIDRLNRSIRKHQFGRSRYEFVCTCNEDYREYYNLITNKELNGRNLLNTQVYEENQELIQELFKKISDLSTMSDPKAYQQLQQEVQRLSRFTTYLKFDILENGNSLRATIGSSSGGETQTPFYVAVLVSLFSVYDKAHDGLQLAVFDEAFDKMDNERIEECIYLLKSLGFQAIIVTPTDKISNLSKVADATLIATTDERNGQRVSTVQKWKQQVELS